MKPEKSKVIKIKSKDSKQNIHEYINRRIDELSWDMGKRNNKVRDELYKNFNDEVNLQK